MEGKHCVGATLAAMLTALAVEVYLWVSAAARTEELVVACVHALHYNQPGTGRKHYLTQWVIYFRAKGPVEATR